jgi:hypothetical protein
MPSLGWLSLAIVVAYGCAAIAPLLRCSVRGGIFVSWCFVPIVLVCPLLIPSANIGLRAASAFASGDIAFKMVDYFRQWGQVEQRIALRDYYGFLIPFPILSVVYPDHKRRLRRKDVRWPNVLRIVGGIAGIATAILALTVLHKIALVRSIFALNQAAMLLTFVVAIESLSRVLYGLERLAGYDTTPIVRNAYLSRNVSEFWRRYNYRVHDWLYRNVFQPAGGRRAPIRCMLLVFVMSGLFHEAMFAIATSRLTGYQLAFFSIQGPAAIASGRIDRLARGNGLLAKVLAHAVTIVFLAVTSVLFFDGVSKVFPFIYAGQSPLP